MPPIAVSLLGKAPPLSAEAWKGMLCVYWAIQLVVLGLHAFGMSSTTNATHGSDFTVFLLAAIPSCLLPYLLAIPLLGTVARDPHRKLKAALLASLLLAAPCWMAAGWLCSASKMSQFAALAERTRPLVAAIRRFEYDRGKPPESLDALVPDYVPSVPTTGMEAWPNYRYIAGKDADSWFGNPWVLVVDVTDLDFDYFYYLPLQNYPESQLDGTLERIGDWAYLHE